jgi:hypothetical protein
MNELASILELIPAVPAGTVLASRDGILAIEQSLCKIVEPGERSDQFPLTHRFADGVYAREILLPAGSLVVGKIHRYGHLNVITKGLVSVLTEDGVQVLKAPLTFISKPGTKRVVFAHEDTVWTTFHGTNPNEVNDINKVEDRIICKTFAEFDALCQLEDKP